MQPPALATAVLLGLAAAQGTTVHVVGVGGPNGTTVFQPQSIQANVGDMVQFHFYAKNHSVAQSSFNAPCTPMAMSMPNATSFFAGFQPTNSTPGETTNLRTFSVRVNDMNPMWFYCPQTKHCQAGMVGAVNAATTGNKTMQVFAALAAQQPESMVPGAAAGAGGAGGAGTTNGGGAAASGGASASGTSAGGPQATANAAPRGFAYAAKQSLAGLGAGGLAALLVL